MSNIRVVGISALAFVTVCAAAARAEDISAKKVSIKNNANPAKRQVQLKSIDADVQLSEADDPGANGASIHVYSATDDFCMVLPSGSDWQSTSSLWKYKNKATKNSAQIGDGKLAVKLKSGVTYTLADNGTQGNVNAQVQFGTAGTRYCMRCGGNTKDDAGKFIGKSCAATPCDVEPSTCDPSSTTTTTTTTTLPLDPCLVEFSMTDAILVGALQFDVDYSASGVNFVGSGDTVSCTTLLPGTLAAYFDDDGAQVLRSGIISGVGGFTGPTPVARCQYSGPGTPLPSDFAINVVDSAPPSTGGMVTNVCGAPATGSSPPFSRDALVILHAAFGSESCQPCECDTNGNGGMAPSAADVLLALRAAVNPAEVMNCPPCGGTPTVIGASGSVAVTVSQVSGCP